MPVMRSRIAGSRTATDPISEGLSVARTRGVSWLRAFTLAFPTSVSGS
jgi:hypothetical protein